MFLPPLDSIFTAVVLGIVEGVTEFLPISSTGHLILVGEAISFDGEKAKSFEVIIQLGAILSVVFLYSERFYKLQCKFSDFFELGKVFRSEGINGAAGLYKLGLVTLPALISGLLFSSKIKSYLFNPTSVAVALAVGGLAMLVIEKFFVSKRSSAKGVDQITWQIALALGVIQCLALWPGMSRAGVVIIGGILLGLSRVAAAEFSFIAAVPVLCAAAGYDFLKVYPSLTLNDLSMLVIGLVVSFVTGLVAIKWLVRILQNHTLVPFGIYRILLAIVVLLTLSRR